MTGKDRQLRSAVCRATNLVQQLGASWRARVRHASQHRASQHVAAPPLHSLVPHHQCAPMRALRFAPPSFSSMLVLRWLGARGILEGLLPPLR